MKKAIERIVAYAVRVSEPEEVILFGSMANGTSNVHSDLDLLLVVDENFSAKQIIERVRHYASEMSISADVLVYSKQDVANASAQRNSFLASILRTGKIAYKKP